MKFAVDRIEDDIVVLENLDDEKITYLNKKELKFEVVEGDILILSGNTYVKSGTEKEKRLLEIKRKLDMLIKE